jgi:pimeloyl-ACP methyl ester carboxylesterase
LTLEIRRLQSWDGTDLAWYEAGDPDAPPMVLCGGLGGGVLIWHPMVERFADRYRIISFDYRGLYQSRRPSHDGAYDLIHHVRDLVHVLDHTQVETPVLVGWSMGVQVGLELHRDHPERLSAMVAVHGTPGRPLARAFDSELTERVAPWIFQLMRVVGRNLGLVGPTLARSPIVVRSFVEIGRRLGCMSEDIDIEAFRDIAEDWTRLDLDAYARIFEALGAHDASDLLPGINTPTLVIAGGADRFTPQDLAAHMVATMPNASMQVVDGATHFGLIEYGHEIADAVEQFIDKGASTGERGPGGARGRGRGRSRRGNGTARAKSLSA